MFTQTELYKSICKGDPDGVFKALNYYCPYSGVMTGEDLNIRDTVTGGTYLHLIMQKAELFKDPPTVTVIYGMACMGIEVDAKDDDGNTCLHLVVKKEGAYRILIALMRCGVDTEIRNKEGKTAEDILLEEKPPGWEEMLSNYNKFKPGLWNALQASKVNLRLVERLLQSWCRVTLKKNGTIINLKLMAQQNPHHIQTVRLLEKYENTIEFALACLSGRSCIIKSWISKDLMQNIDINTTDVSYQKHFKNTPEVSRPLIAAIWEIDKLAMVDILMELKVDVHVLFSAEKERDKTLKPLFFQLICGENIPEDERIIHRVLKECNMLSRNRQGQTIIFEAIKHSKSFEFVQSLFTYGLNIALRDNVGRTARTFALKQNKPTYARLIDQHVLQMVISNSAAQIEDLILRSYDHLLDITDANGRPALDIAREMGNREVANLLSMCKVMQETGKLLFKAIKNGDSYQVKHLMCQNFIALRDKCGRNVIHVAILYQQTRIVHYLISSYPSLLNEADNSGRSPLHYIYVKYEDDLDIQALAKLHGANYNCRDNRGKTPEDYSNCSCAIHLACIKKAIEEFDLEVFLEETDFEEVFFAGIKDGKMEVVKEQVRGLEEVEGVSRYSSRALFECLDSNQVELAKYLVLRGFRTNIWKQYVPCSSDNPLCGMMECGHTVTYFKDRIKELAMYDLLTLVNDVELGKVKTARVYQDPPIYCP